MSFNVLAIPEDATKDHYILRPILDALLKAAGKSQAKLRVLTDPAVKGVDWALNDAFLLEIVGRYPMVDLFLLCVDRDGLDGRDQAVFDRETRVQSSLTDSQSFLGTAAHQELEVWCLAGMENLLTGWRWNDVRSEPHPKETFYMPYAEDRGLLDAPADGREILGREAAKRYASIRSRCPEVATLQKRVAGCVSKA
jgi:hypothetical protein